MKSLSMKSLSRIVVIFAASSCLWSCSGDDNERPESGVLPVDQTFVVFSPALNQLPTPNDLLFAGEPERDGTMFAGVDPSNPVISGIDALDGNSLLAPFDVAFTASLDSTQSLDAATFVQAGSNVIPNPNQNVFLLPLIFPSGDSLLQASADINGDDVDETLEVPSFYEALLYQRAVTGSDVATLGQLAAPKVRAEIISLDGGVNNVVRITPLEPLLPKTKYLVVLANISDANGNPVFPNRAYESLRDPDSNVAGVNPRLVPVRSAIQGWEALAQGYFGFMQTVFDQVGQGLNAPVYDDILMTITFTTTASDDVLTSIAAPETFFERSLRDAYKKDAIVKLVTGEYAVDGAVGGLSSATDLAINQTLAFLLSSQVLPDASPNPLFNASIAGAITAGADYATIAADASAAFIMQSAAAQAAIQVHDSGDQMQGDKAPFVDIASEAIGTVLALSGNNPSSRFPLPVARTTQFFRVDDASDINAALAAPAKIYQGHITLPQFQVEPSATGEGLLTDSWEADAVIGGAIDAGRGNPAGTTPPSSKTTYRYPFPTQKFESTLPLLAVVPDEAVLGNLGITKPANGWPVVIYIHGITADRSAVLPVADAMAFACVNPNTGGPSGAPCFATLAIDQPLHGAPPAGTTVPGLFNASAPGAAISANVPASAPVGPSTELHERHFNLTANALSQPVPMDYVNNIGTSGSLFINLTNFANSRDRLRQMVLDLLNLNASIATMDVDGDGLANDFDMERVYLIGHSLGAIDSIPFLSVNNSAAVQSSPFSAQPMIKASAFISTGGGVPRLLTNSPAFAPRILQGLAAASDQLVQGRSGLESYLNVFQGVLDSVDPMNFAAKIVDQADSGVLLTEIIGDGTAERPKDQTIPNAADTIWGAGNGPLVTTLENGFSINGFPAPLAGTEPLVNQFGAIKTASAMAGAAPAIIVTRFTEGSHGNPVSAGNTAVDPLSSAGVFAEMVSEFVTFFALDGQLSGSIVANPSVVEP